MDYILRTENLTKRFGNKVAVNNLNMTVTRGEIYGFIGKNGAGKTTAMKMVVGTTFPTAGSIELFGGQPLGEARRKIGSLLESPGIYNGSSAKENLLRMSLLCGTNGSEIDGILRLVGLADVGNKKAGAFSLGMKQRLGIGMALIGDPEFMVLDEPINGLDPEGIRAIRDLVLLLNREKGITFLISSHLLDELSKIVTKYGIISDGNLIEEISAQEIVQRTRDGLRIVVDNVDAAVEVLSALAPKDSLRFKDGVLTLTQNYENPAKINAALVNAGINVSELMLHSGGLEEYFIERMGR